MEKDKFDSKEPTGVDRLIYSSLKSLQLASTASKIKQAREAAAKREASESVMGDFDDDMEEEVMVRKRRGGKVSGASKGGKIKKKVRSLSALDKEFAAS
eukprot:CAMPEP_0202958578 /NCGR_PEP_ID=MMETSP1396-20130829/2893_1 /ASSEMBLY_ACC=CAM_ASM_000872 /TAXON_ID= /ORGANISM="Pseudokeronopsis sp., Strain Brazil" /LENGTH=98 /DNA_ID=CAMNT_0049676727 /DNA_START=293 /DNA_END=590 /DNA_ORIENTATION=-